MNWENQVRAAEDVLSSPQVPSSVEIIRLIKMVNPTRLTLSETDRERGYHVKHRLQNLLLEEYGETFHLVPHPPSPDIVLIKHRVLPSVDACHAELASLSVKAIEMAESAIKPPSSGSENPKRLPDKGQRKTGTALSPNEALKTAHALLEEYDFSAAEEALAGIRATGSGDVQVLARAAEILLQEMGAYQRCIELLLAQPRSALKDKGIRELLAVAYHHNGSLPEARAILDELHPAELGKGALVAYADITFKDGNLAIAFQLAKLAEGKEGFVSGLDGLQKEIEAAMSIRAEPLLEKARAAFESHAFEESRRLAREALDLCPNCHGARELLAAIDGINHAAQVGELWARLEETAGERRMALLATLLERDKDQEDRIKMLIREEKERQRGILFDDRVKSLHNLVLNESWPECFDAVWFLARQPEFRERAREVLGLSPFFPVLHQNRRLHAISERSAKDLWLRFVKVKIALAAGKDEGCLKTMEDLKPWFNSSPEFNEEYVVLLQHEQDKARNEIASLLRQSEVPDCPATQVRQIFRCLRKEIAVLPLEERRELLCHMEQRLVRLAREYGPGEPLEAYREALLIGNREKAAYLREEIADRSAIEAIDQEVADKFHIEWEPLTLEISNDLPIDLTTRPPLGIYCPTPRGMLLEDGKDTLVLIDFAARSACRVSSPVFARTAVFDMVGNNDFLFLDFEWSKEECGTTLWRAELSQERARFTASFDMREWFEVEDGFSVSGVMMSSERETDYYVDVKHDEGRLPAKVMKKRLAPKATIASVQAGDLPELKTWRWTSCPDSFIVGGEGQMRHLNRNLTSKGLLSQTPSIYKIDQRGGYAYCMEGSVLTQRGLEFKLIRDYKSALTLSFFDPERVHGLSMETRTALTVHGDGMQSFYNLNNNKFSSKIRVGRVIPSHHDGRWYCFDYNREEGRLSLRDITEDIHTLLQWEEFFRPCGDDDTEMMERYSWFNDNENFVYNPLEWGTPWTPEEGE